MNSAETNIETYIKAFKNREAVFSYRGRTYNFSLSLELFSSAGIDAGSGFLLKVFSNFMDRNPRVFGRPYCDVLDAGSGTGVLAVCAAGALSALYSRTETGFHVHAQDRDELARIFTLHNARRNGITEQELSAHSEPLLSGVQNQSWDFILTNIPAKAGRPVLEDFTRRSAGLLKKDGLVFLVAVNTLANFFRSQIAALPSPLFAEETGKEHTVFIYGAPQRTPPSDERPIIFDRNFPAAYPFYIRNRASYEMENVPYNLDTVYGASGFDEPGGGVKAAVKLAVKINLKGKLGEPKNSANTEKAALLINDTGQGHFALWLAAYLKTAEKYRWFISGRNILSLGAAASALRAVLDAAKEKEPVFSKGEPSVLAIPSAGISAGTEDLLKTESFALVCFFPEAIPDMEKTWGELSQTAARDGIVIAGMTSTEAVRFDKQKPKGFTRMGEIKRKGFMALSYRRDSRENGSPAH